MRQTWLRIVAVVVCKVTVFAFAAGEACGANPVQSDAKATWPQWRGPQRDGQVQGAPWPTRLSEGALQRQWRVPLGPSYSGPIVSESLVFVTETDNATREVVRALDRVSGQLRWQTGWDGALAVPFFAKANGDWIRSTPAYDGASLYVAGMRDVLHCLDAETGAIRWRVDFVEQLAAPLPDFGCVCSPLVDGDHVYIQAGSGFCKLDKHTGKILWRTLEDKGGLFGSAFSSPYIAEVAGKRQILVQTRERLAGVDLETGNVLWSHVIPAFRGMNILTPTAIGNTVFTSAYGGRSLLLGIDSQTDTLAPSENWTNKVTGYMSSPLVIDGHIYLHLRNRRFHCIKGTTGESTWTTQPYGEYWSMVANGDGILALDERGELLLIRANPEKFELLDSTKISDTPTWAHLAVCGEELFIRELDGVTSYRWREAQ